jgi:hypothetical protein
MNNLNSIEGEGYKDYNQPLEEEGLIDKTLPFEIFENVLSYLDDMDLQQASLVNHVWSERAINAVNLRLNRLAGRCDAV